MNYYHKDGKSITNKLVIQFIFLKIFLHIILHTITMYIKYNISIHRQRYATILNDIIPKQRARL